MRLPARRSAQTAILLRLLETAMENAANGALRGNTVVLHYGHEAEITAAISSLVDVRIVWGGDDTVRRIREAPLAPHGKDIGFPDRSSLAVLQADAWLAADGSSRRTAAERFFNDTYWFDQMACSSPRVLVWCGDAAACAEASGCFLRLLREQIDRKAYQLPTGAYLKKLAFAYGAILNAQDARAYAPYGNELTVITLETLRGLSRQHCGGGLLYQVFVGGLDEVRNFIERRDQTLTTFGFDEATLRNFARALNGKGIDRIVPMGSALEFSRFWDGYDLLQELTRRVYIGCEGAPAGA
jgi:drug/metabolite transporter superfamily protein YnfA